ncbi:hypothetical protein HIM_00972 [Hirsutella minnesotensis 3608]|nr:hypothetical protein HIM_00972 [Hirsutella minnesotensis 3608]
MIYARLVAFAFSVAICLLVWPAGGHARALSLEKRAPAPAAPFGWRPFTNFKVMGPGMVHPPMGPATKPAVHPLAHGPSKPHMSAGQNAIGGTRKPGIGLRKPGTTNRWPAAWVTANRNAANHAGFNAAAAANNQAAAVAAGDLVSPLRRVGRPPLAGEPSSEAGDVSEEDAATDDSTRLRVSPLSRVSDAVPPAAPVRPLILAYHTFGDDSWKSVP